METNDPVSQLDEMGRLQAVTRIESGRAPRSAPVVMALATVAFFGGYALDSAAYRLIAPVVWTGFVMAWVVWLKSGKRAIAGRPQRTRREWYRAFALWVGLLILVNAIVAVGSHVSWLLVGVALGSLGVISGGISARRARRA